jgi:hypothetical protein
MKFYGYSFVSSATAVVVLASVFTTPSFAEVDGSETWRWINLADWHSAEKYVQVWKNSAKGMKSRGWGEKGYASLEAYENAMRSRDVALISRIKKEYGGELMVIPGDTQAGHWERPEFRASMRSVYPGLSDVAIVIQASHLCYGGMRNAFMEAGYDTMLVAVGDHEIGDNPWHVNSDVAQMVPSFRAGHADVFNEAPVRNPENPGNPRLWTYERNATSSNRQFDKLIGSVSSRPVGTLYEETSFAWQYKNVLFVTVDVFRQDNPSVRLGEEGSVTGDVEGAHLLWFKRVLAEAGKDRSIKHIIVQSHLPILYPVRKYASSGMFMDGDVDSAFWLAMRESGVDLYLAGEVHSNTVTIDPASNLVQWVARGNAATNFNTVDVLNDKIVVQAWKNKDTHGLYNDILLGQLVIDKTGLETVVTTSGLLEAIKPDGLMLHYTFDDLIPAEVVLTGVSDPVVSGITCDQAFVNDGEFSNEYTAWANKTSITEGMISHAASLDAGRSLVGLSSIGPLSQGHPRTIALWVRTESNQRQILFNTTSYWGEREFFNLSVNQGRLELMLSETQHTMTQSAVLSDGAWHHVAVTVPYAGATLGNTKLYIDGVLQTDVTCEGGSTKVSTNQANWIGIGSLLNKSSIKLDQQFGMQALDGEIDDFALWTRALSDEELARLVAGAATGHNASDIQAIFVSEEVELSPSAHVLNIQ